MIKWCMTDRQPSNTDLQATSSGLVLEVELIRSAQPEEEEEEEEEVEGEEEEEETQPPPSSTPMSQSPSAKSEINLAMGWRPSCSLKVPI